MLKTKTTSSSSKFCADFKTAQVWLLILLSSVENEDGVQKSRFGKKRRATRLKRVLMVDREMSKSNLNFFLLARSKIVNLALKACNGKSVVNMGEIFSRNEMVILGLN